MDTAVALIDTYLHLNGYFTVTSGQIIRMIAFGSAYEPHRDRQWRTVPMAHVVGFIRQYLRQHWDVLDAAQFKDSALAMLALLEKWDPLPQNAAVPGASDTR